MEIKNEFYLPVEIVFNLLCACKKGYGNNPKKLRAYLHPKNIWAPILPEHLSIPRVSFWIRLCESALLIDESEHHWPTFFAEEWLNWSLDKQIKHLVKAWVKSPLSEKVRSRRSLLLSKLLQNFRLNKSLMRELNRIQVFRISDNQHLNEFGDSLLNASTNSNSPKIISQPWKFENESLIVPYPPNWKLLWELETYLDRQIAGKYPINLNLLQKAVPRGALIDNPGLIEILNQGTANLIPEDIANQINNLKQIRINKGYVLEFETANDLLHLRESTKMYSELKNLISPRHIFISYDTGPQIIKTLQQKGLISNQDSIKTNSIDHIHSSIKNISLTIKEFFYLFTILLFMANSDLNSNPPADLIEKFSQKLEFKEQMMAKRKSDSMMGKLKPVINQETENSTKNINEENIVAVLENAIFLSESIKIFYKSSKNHFPEARIVTPLLIEKRFNQKYMIAYCHLRKANRTFRLDKVQLG